MRSINTAGVDVPSDRRPDTGWSTATAEVGPRVAADTGAFDALYRDEWHGLLALGWSLTGSWSAAEELVQDAFLDGYRRWDEVGRLDRPGAWVRRAVVNRAASHHRHQAVARRGLVVLGSRSTTEADSAATDRTADRAAEHVGDPVFWAAVRSLPRRQAEAVTLHYLEDRSVAEIAEILGCRPATVKVHLHRGRQALARRLAAVTAPAMTGSALAHGTGAATTGPTDPTSDRRTTTTTRKGNDR
ncbi:MAG: putative polymerase subfamily sigma factor [Acidimicrobiales bacterium]|nr:putative polymerase subfamily sigma factor [Acidimicrobiales bacterium]